MTLTPNSRMQNNADNHLPQAALKCQCILLLAQSKEMELLYCGEGIG
jgi:hypothetical protein